MDFTQYLPYAFLVGGLTLTGFACFFVSKKSNLKENGIIRKCNSAWNTPLVCIWKKERKDIRLCMDFRQLNLITDRQAFPMPNVGKMLDRLHGARYFSSIDLGNAYYQIELEEGSQEKTAFSPRIDNTVSRECLLA